MGSGGEPSSRAKSVIAPVISLNIFPDRKKLNFNFYSVDISLLKMNIVAINAVIAGPVAAINVQLVILEY